MAREYDTQQIMNNLKQQNEMDKVWLITWNQNNWSWGGYETICAATKIHKTIVESWTCVSTKPKIGEEVFLIKIGQEPRGIIGHGKVVREQYVREHFNLKKAAEGKTEKAIDVEFDRVLNFRDEKIILQDELNEKCPGQHWSPQGSGIEIKQEVLPTLKKLWKAVTETDIEDDYWPSQKEYPVNISKDDWKRFLQEIEMPTYKGCIQNCSLQSM